ncbi:larval cuticle protein 65Ag1-like [Penaeus monodon]|uniref:larval cuticle protein 65Ag1-like n=1 Tax=Penaeus monodon TaxID=6687 RepID=UPI0018A6DD23|nr:larval cuticle protein 65Ag1-like [Penaeus monodon]
MNFVLVLLTCLMAAVTAAPQFIRPNFPDRPFVAILRDERQDLGDGAFSYVFEAANGIRESRVGYPGSKGQTNMQGSYSFPLDDGTFAEVRFVADESGFRAELQYIPIILHNLGMKFLLGIYLPTLDLQITLVIHSSFVRERAKSSVIIFKNYPQLIIIMIFIKTTLTILFLIFRRSLTTLLEVT